MFSDIVFVPCMLKTALFDKEVIPLPLDTEVTQYIMIFGSLTGTLIVDLILHFSLA